LLEINLPLGRRDIKKTKYFRERKNSDGGKIKGGCKNIIFNPPPVYKMWGSHPQSKGRSRQIKKGLATAQTSLKTREKARPWKDIALDP